MADDLSTDPLSRAAEELGEPVAVYALGPGRAGAKAACAVGLIVSGVVANALWWTVGPARFDHLVLLILFAPPMSGVSMLRHLILNRGLRVALFPAGLLRVRRGEVESYPWTEVEEVRLRADRGETRFERDESGRITAGWLAVEPPLVKFWDAGLTVRQRDGAELTLTPALAGYPDLAERVQRETFAALWPGVWDQFWSGEVVPFGKFTADAGGLSFGSGKLLWEDVAGAAVAQKKFTVKRVGKWLPWAVADLADVPNPHLLLALIEEMRPATGEAVNADG